MGEGLKTSEQSRWLSYEEVKHRFRPGITLSDPEWIQRYSWFMSVVQRPTQDVRAVLKSCFPRNTVFMLLPLSHRNLRIIQQLNSARYRQCLQQRFGDISNDGPAKLALTYFGLPVEPHAAFLYASASSGSLPDWLVDDRGSSSWPKYREMLSELNEMYCRIFTPGMMLLS